MKKFVMKKDVWYGLALVLFAVVIVLVLFLPIGRNTETFALVDNCGVGPGGQLVSHTIQRESDCRIQCTQYCGTFDMEYSSSEFYNMTDSVCYGCNCTCFT